MDERRANIDLVFRNGLKDYEVLPPAVVWNNIDGRIKRHSRPAYLMRAAAMVAVAVTLSFLTYRWTVRTSAIHDNSSVALNTESSPAPPAGNIMAPAKPGEKTLTSTGSYSPEPARNEPAVEQPSAGDNTEIAFVSLPPTNIQLPANVAKLTIVRPYSDFGENSKNTVSINSLTLDNSKGYQDYLVAEDNSATNTRKWSISALASPTYYGKINKGTDDLSRQILSSEKAVVSYSGGVTLSYKVNRRFSIQSGLFYSSVGEELTGISSFAGFQKYDKTKGDHNFAVLTTNGTIYTNNPDVFLVADGSRIITSYTNDVFDPKKVSLDYISNNMRQSFSYLELPVFLRYKVIDKTLGFNLIGGLSYNMLVDNSVYTVVDGNKYMIGSTEGMNTFSLSSSVGMGMEYKFSDKLSLNLEPTFRYYINSFNTTYGSNFHPYSFGIFSGLSYKF